jgi:hypothetical protein
MAANAALVVQMYFTPDEMLEATSDESPPYALCPHVITVPDEDSAANAASLPNTLEI